MNMKRRQIMRADYKNWVPKGMVCGFIAGTGVLVTGFVISMILTRNAGAPLRIGLNTVLGLAALACAMGATWSVLAYNKFSYNGKRQMSKQIIDGTAKYVNIPDGGIGLDVGCGSGALTIACAKRNPKAQMKGIDRWGKEYASFSKNLCESNSKAEGVNNTSFAQGDAVHLDFEDETFDAVTSNYVYHNIGGVNKQDLLLETLRVLKKGGTFAIHDIMSKSRYGDMGAFADKLKALGYKEVNLIPTDDGRFMTKGEGKWLGLSGSTLLVGKK
jgi:ubiquinone/menaquinone biosynthesis C-methylase UbiE